MFDIGFLEIVIISIVGLVVIGPERLPDVARTVGRWVGRTRRFVNNVKADIDKELRQEELKKAIERDAGLDEIKQIMNTDRFSLEEEEPANRDDYLVKAIDDVDQKAAAQKATQQFTDNVKDEEWPEDWDEGLSDDVQDEITSNNSGHYDAADNDNETLAEESSATKK